MSAKPLIEDLQVKRKKFSNKARKLSTRLREIHVLTSNLEFIKNEEPSREKTYLENYLRRESNKKYIPNEIRLFGATLINLSHNLPELIVNKKKICSIILNTLTTCNEVLTYPVVCISLIILAKELRHELMDELEVIFDTIESELEKHSQYHELDRIAHLLQSLTYIVRYLQKYISRDILFWFAKYANLLGNKRRYIRMFIAENFAILLKKLDSKSLKSFIPKSLDLVAGNASLRDNELLFDGIAHCWVDCLCVKNFNVFTPRSPAFLQVLLKTIEWKFKKNEFPNLQQKQMRKRVFCALVYVLSSLVKHGEDLSFIFHALHTEIVSVGSKWLKLTPSTPNEVKTVIGVHVGRLCMLLATLVRDNKKKIPEDSFMQTVQFLSHFELVHSISLYSTGSTDTNVETLATHLNAYWELFIELCSRHKVKFSVGMLTNALQVGSPERERARGLGEGAVVCFAKMVRVLSYRKITPEVYARLCTAFLDFLAARFEAGPGSAASVLEVLGFVTSPDESELRKRVHRIIQHESLVSKTLEVLTENSPSETKELSLREWELVAQCLKIAVYFGRDVSDAVLDATFRCIQEKLLQAQKIQTIYVQILAHVIHCVAAKKKQGAVETKYCKPIVEILARCKAAVLDPSFLKPVDMYFSKYVACVGHHSLETLEGSLIESTSVAPTVLLALNHKKRTVRMYILKILLLFNFGNGAQQQQRNPTREILEHMHEIECRGIGSWDEIHKKCYHVSKINELVSHHFMEQKDTNGGGSGSGSAFFSVLLAYVVGAAHNKIDMFHKEVVEMARMLCRVDAVASWEYFYPHFKRFFIQHCEAEKKKVVVVNLRAKKEKKFVDFEAYDEMFSKATLYTAAEETQEQEIWSEMTTSEGKLFEVFWTILFENNSYFKLSHLVEIFREFCEHRLPKRLYEISKYFFPKVNNESAKMATVLSKISVLTTKENSGICAELSGKFLIPLLSSGRKGVVSSVLTIIQNLENEKWFSEGSYRSALSTLLSVIDQKSGLIAKVGLFQTMKHPSEDSRNKFIDLCVRVIYPYLNHVKRRCPKREEWKEQVYFIWQFVVNIFYDLEISYFVSVVFSDFVVLKNSQLEVKFGNNEKNLNLDIIDQFLSMSGTSLKKYPHIVSCFMDLMLQILNAGDGGNQKSQSVYSHSVSIIYRFMTRNSSFGIFNERIIALFTQCWDFHYNRFSSSPSPISLMVKNEDSMNFPGVFRFPLLWLVDENLISLFTIPQFSMIPVQILRLINNPKIDTGRADGDGEIVIRKILESIHHFFYLRNTRVNSNILLTPVSNEQLGSVYHHHLVPDFLDILYAFVKKKGSGKNRQKLRKRVFLIVNEMSDLFGESCNNAKFASIILFFYGGSYQPYSPIVFEKGLKILKIFRHYVDFLTDSNTKLERLKAISRLFLFQNDVNFRRKVVDFFQSFPQSIVNSNVTDFIVSLHNNQIKDVVDTSDDFNLGLLISNLIYFLSSSGEESFLSDVDVLTCLKTVLERMKKLKNVNWSKGILRNFVMIDLQKKVNVDIFSRCHLKWELFSLMIVNFREYRGIELFAPFFACLKPATVEESFRTMQSILESNEEMKVGYNWVFDLFFPLMNNLLSNFPTHSDLIIKCFVLLSKRMSFTVFKKFLLSFLSPFSSNSRRGNEKLLEAANTIILDFLVEKREMLESNVKVKSFFTKSVLKVLVNIKQMLNFQQISTVKLLKFSRERQLVSYLAVLVKHLSSQIMAESGNKEVQKRCRAILCQIVEELTTDYLKVIVKEINDVMKKGRHEISKCFTYHAILRSIRVPSVKVNESMKLLCQVLLKNLKNISPKKHGVVVEMITECFRFMARLLVPFPLDSDSDSNSTSTSGQKVFHLNELIQEITNVMRGTEKMFVFNRMEGVLNVMALGVSKNHFLFVNDDTSGRMKILLEESFLDTMKSVIVVKTVDETKSNAMQPNRAAQSEKYIVREEPRSQKKTVISSNEIGIQFYLKRFYANTVLKCLYHNKSYQFSKRETVIPVILQQVNLKQPHLAILAIQLFTHFLERRDKYGEVVTGEIISKMNQSIFQFLAILGVDTTVSAWNAIFRFFSVLLNSHRGNDLKLLFNDFQLNYLLDLLKMEIMQNSTKYEVYSIIKLFIVDYRLEHPICYDYCEKLRYSMLTLQSVPICSTCQTILSSFFLHFKMAETVLLDYVMFINKSLVSDNVANSSKVFLLGLMRGIIRKFPLKFLDQKMELFFLPLSSQLCRERDENIQKEIDMSLEKLLRKTRLDLKNVERMIEKWLTTEKFRIVALLNCLILLRFKEGTLLLKKNLKLLLDTISQEVNKAGRKLLKKKSKSGNTVTFSEARILHTSLCLLVNLHREDVINSVQLRAKFSFISKKFVKVFKAHPHAGVREEVEKLKNVFDSLNKQKKKEVGNAQGSVRVEKRKRGKNYTKKMAQKKKKRKI